ncbi:MAG TPA: type II secretion system protein GspG [Gammaproteobacteria bacterium]|nr:type II secretion system protein GspG [Gammaproteobacteria bacterium]OUX32853.1 MAG: type II secretion system protein GspG [Gammaproteobacteria bacterium TMED260]RPG45709.1 MAG: type II secretion system protein GspG [Gammaproteobacteria bacterium TMED163]HAO88132.1 type II secretion system protein GspG [Gammaproteobacteria bacterium]HAR90938.1 type II secretion system protein GspG [Gammaproteobacteria bacterium]|tara:strand:+ start:8956 stop:9378 length:423 start_codon:yes stop_codon:yes gene_type:complete
MTKAKRYQGQTFSTNPGFTLIEILVVMAIIGMLAVMVAPNIFNQQAGAQRDAALSQISSLEAALDTYRLDVGEYPDSLEGLIENDSGRAAWNGPYLRREVPMDPWGNEYIYESEGRSFTLVSYGPDGERGGEGDDADIGL